MALPTRDELLTLDYADLGTPFVRVATGTLATQTLDTADLGLPFVGTAAAAASSTNDSSATLPAISGDGATPGVVILNSSDLTLLAITASGTADSGPVGHSRGVSGQPLSLPTITGSGSTFAPNLPALSGSATAFSGSVATSVQNLEIGGSATANPGIVGSSAATLPAITGGGATPNGSTATLPAIEGSATALTGMVASSTASLAVITGEAAGSVPVVGASSLTLLALRGEGTAFTGVVGASSATLAAIVLAAEGTSGALGSSSLEIPVITGAGTGYVEVVGTSIVTLPAIVGSGQAGTLTGTTYSAYALNTERRALTTYSGLQIRGLTQFNGVYLAAGPGGLFTLSGDTDDSALINATVRLANTDFGDPKLKRVEAMYVNYRSDGDLSLKVITDQHDEYDYPLQGMGYTTLDNQRVKVGKGLKGVYWTFELTNVDGADFEFDRLQVDPLMTSRKIG